MNLAIRIQSSGKRNQWVSVMKHLIDDPRVKVIGGGSSSAWESCKQCLLSAGPKDTHLLILQDDALPCKDFVRTVEKIISLLPDEIITLFTADPIADQALSAGNNWAKLKLWFGAVAYVLPVRVAKDIVRWNESNIKEEYQPSDDERMGMYCYYQKRFVYATVPSLVEHQGWNSTVIHHDNPRITPYSPQKRMARYFIGVENSGLDIDWSKDLNDSLQTQLSGDDSMFCHYLKESKGGE